MNKLIIFYRASGIRREGEGEGHEHVATKQVKVGRRISLKMTNEELVTFFLQNVCSFYVHGLGRAPWPGRVPRTCITHNSVKHKITPPNQLS